MIEYLKRLLWIRRYYFVSYSYKTGFGNITFSALGSVNIKTLQSKIEDNAKVDKVVVLYYKKISKKTFKNGTL